MADIYAFLELEGIEGESTDEEYKDKIELTSFSWGATNHSTFASGTGSSNNKGELAEISCSKHTFKASLKLLERTVTGQSFESGTLTLLKLHGEDKIAYFQVKMKHVAITSFHVSASGSGELPSESFSLHYVEVQSTYKPQSNTGEPLGNVDFGWNLQTNSAA